MIRTVITTLSMALGLCMILLSWVLPVWGKVPWWSIGPCLVVGVACLVLSYWVNEA